MFSSTESIFNRGNLSRRYGVIYCWNESYSSMNEPIVKTQSGAVRGRNVQGVAAFKGIPNEKVA